MQEKKRPFSENAPLLAFYIDTIVITIFTDLENVGGHGRILCVFAVHNVFLSTV